ncbi:tetratricopeptide repeat protein [Chitinimonas viridis]|uniref:Tetratricopeptide repeat protein n=1 Tax=Chitinimonas viridis TaxID=664880 RepID=A0ABT8BA95_9NEIS|nr:tetratricopeptide repeat protein [Chitinimonas viridis]MDN3579063.1 tetratricopeptide repeat protein [Chitinimonas viridis]
MVSTQESAENWEKEATALMQAGNLGLAATGLQARLAESPLDARALALMGMVQLMLERYEEAVAFLRVSLLREPNDARTLNSFGLGLRASGMLHNARQALEQALALEPSDPAINANLANVCASLGDQARVRALLEPMVDAIDEAPVEWWVMLAGALLAQGEAHAAHARLDTAVARWPDQLALRVQQIVAISLAGQHAAALDHLQTLVSMVNGDPEVLGRLANQARAFKANELALACFEQLRRQPGSNMEATLNATMNFGIVLADLDRHADAVAAFSEAIALVPELADAYRMRGVSRAKLGQTASAISDLQRSLQLHPAHPDALAALETLQAAHPAA